ncbi:MAG: hypothetical protein Q9159_004262 [Coniocarpon cinnabarinum]
MTQLSDIHDDADGLFDHLLGLDDLDMSVEDQQALETYVNYVDYPADLRDWCDSPNSCNIQAETKACSQMNDIEMTDCHIESQGAPRNQGNASETANSNDTDSQSACVRDDLLLQRILGSILVPQSYPFSGYNRLSRWISTVIDYRNNSFHLVLKVLGIHQDVLGMLSNDESWKALSDQLDGHIKKMNEWGEWDEEYMTETAEKLSLIARRAIDELASRQVVREAVDSGDELYWSEALNLMDVSEKKAWKHGFKGRLDAEFNDHGNGMLAGIPSYLELKGLTTRALLDRVSRR